MKKNGVLIAAAVAGMFGIAAAPALAGGKDGGKVHCQGVNECKGKGACKTAANECAGKNECKGKGWIEASAKECKTKGGTPAKM